MFTGPIRQTVYREDGTQVELEFMALQEPQPNYPSDYFAALGHKPPVTWYEVDENDVNTLRGSIVTCLSESKDINRHHLYAYLCYVGKRMNNTSENEWKSFGQIICPANGSISVKDIFHVENIQNVSVNQVAVGENISVNEDDDVWIVLSLFIIWNLDRMGNKPGSWIANQADAKLSEIVPRRFNINVYKFWGVHANWGRDPVLSKLVAGFDMYLNYFNQDKMAIVRFATEVSRFKDCLVLKDIDFVRGKLGLENNDQFFEWMIVEPLKREASRVNKPGEELDDPYSYSPYISDILQVRQSPYSASINSGLHVFVNMIGAALNIQKCSNRKMLEPVPIEHIMVNLACVIWAFGSHSSTNPDLPPITRSGSEFEHWFINHNCLIPYEVALYTAGKFRANTCSRPNTIAAFGKNWYSAL